MVVTLRRSNRRPIRASRVGSSGSNEENDVFSEATWLNPNSLHSPLYLNSSDHPGMVIVSVQLDGSNYNQWNTAMKIALDAKNKLAFIDGSLSRPEEGNPLSRIWSRCNSMVKSWLLNTVSMQIYGSILSFDDAAQIWKDLHNRYHMTNLPRTFQLIQQIQELRQGSMDLAGYYTSLKTLWDNLDGAEATDAWLCCHSANCASQEAIKAKVERGRIIKFLAGLNEKYSIIRGQIIMKKPLPNLAEIYNILDQDDSQRQFNTSKTVAPAAFSVQSGSSQFGENKMVESEMLNAFQRKDKPICSHCGYSGHTIDKCYKIHGFPIGWKKGKSGSKISDKNQGVKSTTAQISVGNKESDEKGNSGGFENMIGNLSRDQIQSFIAYFSSQLNTKSASRPFGGHNTTAASSSGHYQGVDDWKR